MLMHGPLINDHDSVPKKRREKFTINLPTNEKNRGGDNMLIILST